MPQHHEQSLNQGKAAFHPSEGSRVRGQGQSGAFCLSDGDPLERSSLPACPQSLLSPLVTTNGKRSCVVGSCPSSYEAMDKKHPRHPEASPHVTELRQQADPSPLFSHCSSHGWKIRFPPREGWTPSLRLGARKSCLGAFSPWR